MVSFSSKLLSVATGGSERHSEIVCEKGNSDGKDYRWVPVVMVKQRCVVE